MASHMRLPIKGTQTEARLLALKVDASAITTTASSAGLSEGGNDANISKASAAATDITIAYDIAFLRAPCVTVTPLASSGVQAVVKSNATTGCTINVRLSTGTLSNAIDFDVMVLGWDSSQAY